jgi:hypothetical protein
LRSTETNVIPSRFSASSVNVTVAKSASLTAPVTFEGLELAAGAEPAAGAGLAAVLEVAGWHPDSKPYPSASMPTSNKTRTGRLKPGGLIVAAASGWTNRQISA